MINIPLLNYFSHPLPLYHRVILIILLDVTNEKIYWRLRPKVTSEMRWYHVLMMLNDVSRQIQRDNHDPRQVTLFYYKFRGHEVKAGQPNLTPSRRKKEGREVQAKLFY